LTVSPFYLLTMETAERQCPRCGAPAVIVFVIGQTCRLVCGACAVLFDRKVGVA